MTYDPIDHAVLFLQLIELYIMSAMHRRRESVVAGTVESKTLNI